jgi:NH3-dependent NAD+ synthetase
MYDVNGSVPKTLMRHIVRFIADEAGSIDSETGDPENEPLSEVLNDILDTPISPELLPPSGEEISQSTEDLVGPAVFLASDASNFVNGHILYVDGGILAYIGKQP